MFKIFTQNAYSEREVYVKRIFTIFFERSGGFWGGWKFCKFNSYEDVYVGFFE